MALSKSGAPSVDRVSASHTLSFEGLRQAHPLSLMIMEPSASGGVHAWTSPCTRFIRGRQPGAQVRGALRPRPLIFIHPDKCDRDRTTQPALLFVGRQRCGHMTHDWRIAATLLDGAARAPPYAHGLATSKVTAVKNWDWNKGALMNSLKSRLNRTCTPATMALAMQMTPLSLGACVSYQAPQQCDDAGGCDRPGRVDEMLVPNKVEYKLNARVNHVQIHLFTSGKSKADVAAQAKAIKVAVLGGADSPTCRSSAGGVRAQLAVQTELPIEEWSAPGHTQQQKLDPFGARLDALFEAGLPVHLLLPVHGTPGSTWLGVDWPSKRRWSNASVFVPYKPCRDAGAGSTTCVYDRIADAIHVPVVNYLRTTGRLSKVAVVYVANEWGYDPGYSIAQNAAAVRAEWQAATDSLARQRRGEALAYTAARVLAKARVAVSGYVPLGIKLVNVVNPNCGWPKVGTADQLAFLLNDVMKANGDTLGYDVYFWAGDSGYDANNRARLQPFISTFPAGRFEISEFGRICGGSPGVFTQGSRTTALDISMGALAWGGPSLNVFAWNATATSDGCFALANDSTNALFAGAAAEASGISGRMNEIVGASWTPCQ